MARYLVCTLIEIPGPIPDLSKSDEVDAMLVKSLEMDSIKAAWIHKVDEDFETVGAMQ